MVDAADSKAALKHRWRAKMFSKDDEAPPKDPKPKTQTSFKLNEDVNDFLKPSTERAHAHKEAATQAFLASASTSKPRIDTSQAPRWPTASDVLGSALGKSPGIGGLKTSTGRKKGLTVSFVRTQPDVIGVGGDECEDPSIVVYRRKKSNSMSDVDRLSIQSHQDDISLGTRTPTFNNNNNNSESANMEAQKRGIVTRTLTSAGELSPPLRQKLDMGSINTHAAAPPPAPQGLGQMGLGQRPKPLTRAPTGFDINEVASPVSAVSQGRTSLDSTRSYESENASPVLTRKVPDLPPMREEEDADFRPTPLKRTQTGFREQEGDSDNEPMPSMPTVPAIKRLPETNREEESPLDAKASLAERFLQSEPADPNSFSARVKQSMRAEEGRALHEAAQKAAEESKRDSSSSASSLHQVNSVQSTSSLHHVNTAQSTGSLHQINSVQPSAFHVGTPPSSISALTAMTSREQQQSLGSPQQQSNSPQRGLDLEDPHRSRARGASPGRSPLPLGTNPLNTNPRPPSSSSSYSTPSATSRNRAGSMGGPLEPSSSATAPSIHQTSASSEKQQFSAVSQHPSQPVQPQQERSAFASPSREAERPPPPPAHGRNPSSAAVPSARTPSRPRDDTAPSAPSAPYAPLSRSDTKMQAKVAYEDFASRVAHMQGVFELMAQVNGQMYDHSPMEWLRVAIWWFLKGRAGMETQIRTRPKSAEPQPERLTQPHVDLAKTWFVLNVVLRNHPALSKYANESNEIQTRMAKEAGDASNAETFEARDAIISSLRMLLGSMKKHQSMPPTQALIQGQHQELWEIYPRFTPDAASVLSGTAAKTVIVSGQPQNNAALYMPVSDTKTDFCYFRMFVTVSLSTEDPNTDREPLPAIISILRPREGLAVRLAICGQTELINLTVGMDPQVGPTWRDVRWKPKGQGFNLQLRHGFVLNVDMSEPDFRSLWNIVDHTNRIESNLRERKDERIAERMTIREAAYKDPTNPNAFPPDRVRSCKLYVFEKFDISSEGTGKRKLHRGYRVVLVTHPASRTINFANHELGTNEEPMSFSYATEPDQAPALVIRFREEMPDKRIKVCNMHLVFNDGKERNNVFGLLTSMNIGIGEKVFAQVPLKSFSIESADAADGFSQGGKEVLKRLQWVEAKTYNQDPEEAGLESAPTVMSESLRILCRHSAGIFSDRMNLGK
jgi:hypothetical protein